MVGAALACALTRPDPGSKPLRLALLEAKEPSWPHQWPGDFDLRVSALTHASQRLFTALGVWDRIAGLGVSPFREMHVWDAGGHGEIHFDSADIGADSLGSIVENRIIVAALWERLRTREHVEILCPATPASLLPTGSGMELRTAEGHTLQAQLVVGADGADSVIRGLAGIVTRGWRYHQRGVVTTVKPACPHQETAWQRFLPNGPLAFLPLPDGYCSIVWSTTPEEAEALLSLQESDFLGALERAFESRLGPLERVGPRGGFPLRLQHAKDYVRPGVALIGDAAHTIHPLAGQGVNLGLLDAAALADVLWVARGRHQRLGSFAVLRRYERWRKGDNLAMLAAMDGLNRLFGIRAAPVRWVRNLGLNLTDASGPLKNLIIRRAMGLEGDLPPLVRGSLGPLP